jgi:two-component system NarL family sensor kinase
VAAIAVLVAKQSRESAEREIRTLEAHMLAAKKEELRNYVTQARNGFYFIYGSADPDDEDAKQQVSQILAAMIYGEDGSFFVYDYDGNNLVSPRRTELIGTNQHGAVDSEGTPITSELIRLARQGSGYHTYLWPKPSTGEEARMITFVLGFQHWRWAVGTGVFIDDVIASVAATRAEVEARTQQTYLYIAAITLAALLLVFVSGLMLNIRERRLADAKLKELTQRVFDAQEEERGRVARELHDGISQMLVGIRFALDSARRQITSGNPAALDSLEKGMGALSASISEVRRISRDLRPGALDDLGLGPALEALTDDFSERTGIPVDFQTEVFRNRLDPEAKIALYRIAQEALTNIERHAGASHVSLALTGHPKGATLQITDNGKGVRVPGSTRRGAEHGTGLGLRNMQERVEQLDGSLRIKPLSGKNTGTSVTAQVPLAHLLAPAQKPDEPST